MKTIIVSRHQSTVDWLMEVFPGSEVRSHLSPEYQERLRDWRVSEEESLQIVGNLPFPMVMDILPEQYVHVQVTVPQELRGVELTPEQLSEYGSLRTFHSDRGISDGRKFVGMLQWD